jgi:hypothetical protein
LFGNVPVVASFLHFFSYNVPHLVDLPVHRDERRLSQACKISSRKAAHSPKVYCQPEREKMVRIPQAILLQLSSPTEAEAKPTRIAQFLLRPKVVANLSSSLSESQTSLRTTSLRFQIQFTHVMTFVLSFSREFGK